MWLESERIGHVKSILTQEKLYKERANVISEAMGKGQVAEYAPDTITYAGIFPKDHPYNHSISGDMDDVRGITLQDIYDFYDKYYGPNNATLTLVGDVTHEKAEALVRKYFSHIKKGPAIDHGPYKKAPVPVVAAVNKENHFSPLPGKQISRTWPGPKFGSANHVYMENVIGLHSRKFFAALKAAGIKGRSGLQYMPNELAGTISMAVQVHAKQDPAVVEKFMDDFTSEMLGRVYAQSELDQLKVSQRMRNASLSESHMMTAAILSQYVLFTGDVRGLELNQQRLQEATPEDFQAATKKWMGAPYFQATFANRYPKKDSVILTQPDSKLAVAEVALPTQRQHKTLPAVPAQGAITGPDIKMVTLDNGSTLYHVQKKGIAITHMAVLMSGGISAEPKDKAGMAGLMTKLLSGDSKMQTASARKMQATKKGINVSLNTDKDHLVGSLHYINGDGDIALSLLADMLANDHFNQQDVDRIKTQKAPAPRASHIPAAMIERRIMAVNALYENAPDAKVTDQAAAVIEPSITLKDVTDWRSKWVNPNNAVIVVVTGEPLAITESALNKSLGQWASTNAQTAKNVIK